MLEWEDMSAVLLLMMKSPAVSGSPRMAITAASEGCASGIRSTPKLDDEVGPYRATPGDQTLAVAETGLCTFRQWWTWSFHPRHPSGERACELKATLPVCGLRGLATTGTDRELRPCAGGVGLANVS